MSLRFFVFDVEPGNEDFMYKRMGAKIFLCGPKKGKVLLRSSAAVKNGSSLEVGCRGVWNWWSQAKNFLTL